MNLQNSADIIYQSLSMETHQVPGLDNVKSYYKSLSIEPHQVLALDTYILGGLQNKRHSWGNGTIVMRF